MNNTVRKHQLYNWQVSTTLESLVSTIQYGKKNQFKNMDQGVIEKMKRMYKKEMLRKLLILDESE